MRTDPKPIGRLSAHRGTDDSHRFTVRVRVITVAEWLKGRPALSVDLTPLEALTLAESLTHEAVTILRHQERRGAANTSGDQP